MYLELTEVTLQHSVRLKPTPFLPQIRRGRAKEDGLYLFPRRANTVEPVNMSHDVACQHATCYKFKCNVPYCTVFNHSSLPTLLWCQSVTVTLKTSWKCSSIPSLSCLIKGAESPLHKEVCQSASISACSFPTAANGWCYLGALPIHLSRVPHLLSPVSLKVMMLVLIRGALNHLCAKLPHVSILRCGETVCWLSFRPSSRQAHLHLTDSAADSVPVWSQSGKRIMRSWTHDSRTFLTFLNFKFRSFISHTNLSGCCVVFWLNVM